MQQFTPRAQQVLALARKEAIRFKHNYIGTEHILLGIIKLGQGVAVNVLRKMGINPSAYDFDVAVFNDKFYAITSAKVNDLIEYQLYESENGIVCRRINCAVS